MQSIALIPASDGTTNASLMTIQTIRASGATAIAVNTVSGVPVKFYGSMGTPHTFTDPVTSETITVISDATAVDFAGHVDTGQLIIDAIAPGYLDTNGSKVGDIVIIRPITEWANNIHNILAAEHLDNGKHGAVTTTTLAASGLITANGGLTVPTGQPLTLPNNGVTSAMLASPAILRAYAPTDYVGLINTWSTAVLTVTDGVNVGGWVSDGNGWIVPISGKYLISIQATEQDVPNWGTFGIGQIAAGMGVSATATPPSQPGWYNRKGIGYNPDTLQTSRIYTLAAGQHVFLQTYAGTNTAGNYRLRSGGAADGSWIELTYIAP